MAEDRDAPGDSGRDDSEWHRDRFPAWDSEKSALRVARTEARESLAETISAIRRIDESATTTLRIDLVILGLALTAASAFQSVSALVNVLTVSGFVGVMLSALVTVLPTLGADYPTGVSEDYLREFQRASWSEREWNEWMLREYSSWLADAKQMANGEARLLFYARALLGAGLLSLILGTVLGIAGVLDVNTGVEVAFDASAVWEQVQVR